MDEGQSRNGASPTPTVPRTASRTSRAFGAVFAGGCLALLVTGSILTPSPDGHGTHTQLGMTDCMWAASFDRPCPTCGMTTAFAHAGDGAFFRSFLTQPMGFLLAIATATLFWGSLHVTTTGSRLGAVGTRILGPRLLLVLALLTLASWAYKFVTWGES